MAGTFSERTHCPHCRKELSRMTVSLFGKPVEVTCYGSCGCEESMYDGMEVEPGQVKYARAGIPQRYLGAEQDLQGYDALVARGASLYVHGPFGPGKTHFAAALAKSLIDAGQTVRFENSKHLITEIQGTFDGGGSSMDILNRVYNCRVLVLDDLGKEQPTPYTLSMLYEVIDTRYAAMKPVVVTSNFARDELLGRWAAADEATAESIVSRLCDGVETLYMGGEDRRLA